MSKGMPLVGGIISKFMVQVTRASVPETKVNAVMCGRGSKVREQAWQNQNRLHVISELKVYLQYQETLSMSYITFIV